MKLLWAFSPSAAAGKSASTRSEMRGQDAAGNWPGPTPNAACFAAIRSPVLLMSNRIRSASAADREPFDSQRRDRATTTADNARPHRMVRLPTLRLRTAAASAPQHAAATAVREPVHHSAAPIETNAAQRQNRLSAIADNRAGTTNSA